MERHHAIQTLPGVDGAEPSVEELEGTVDTDADENRHQVWGTKMLGKPTFGRGMKKFFGLGEEGEFYFHALVLLGPLAG